MEVQLLTTAYNKEQLPELSLPSFAFVGRSNVGKSTLINKLLNRKNFARVSRYAGKTISINFYKINNAFIFIDLPGYGYARQSTSNINEWRELIEYFLVHNKKFLTLFLLLDVRRGITNLDLEMHKYMIYNNIKFFIVLTKIDKVSRNIVSKTMHTVSTILDYNNTIYTYSYKSTQSLSNLWYTINKVLYAG